MNNFSVSDITRAIIMNAVGTVLLYIACLTVFSSQTLTAPATIIVFFVIWIGLFAYQLVRLRRRRQFLTLGETTRPSIASQQTMKLAFSAPALVLYAVLVAGLVAAVRYL